MSYQSYFSVPAVTSGLLSSGGSFGYSLLPRQHCMCGRSGWTQSNCW